MSQSYHNRGGPQANFVQMTHFIACCAMVQLIGEINFTEIKHGARLINERLQGSFIGARVFSPVHHGRQNRD